MKLLVESTMVLFSFFGLAVDIDALIVYIGTVL